MDESSVVMPSPDAAEFGEDSSGISATDFHFPSSPTKARLGQFVLQKNPVKYVKDSHIIFIRIALLERWFKMVEIEVN